MLSAVKEDDIITFIADFLIQIRYYFILDMVPWVERKSWFIFGAFEIEDDISGKGCFVIVFCCYRS